MLLHQNYFDQWLVSDSINNLRIVNNLLTNKNVVVKVFSFISKFFCTGVYLNKSLHSDDNNQSNKLQKNIIIMICLLFGFREIRELYTIIMLYQGCVFSQISISINNYFLCKIVVQTKINKIFMSSTPQYYIEFLIALIMSLLAGT